MPIWVSRQGAPEDAHESVASGTERIHEMPEPQTTCSEGNRCEDARQLELANCALRASNRQNWTKPHWHQFGSTSRRLTDVTGRLLAREFNNEIDPEMCAATPPLEASKLLTVKLAALERERRDAIITTDDNNSSIMIRVDVHRAYFHAQDMPNTFWKCRIRINLGEARCAGV